MMPSPSRSGYSSWEEQQRRVGRKRESQRWLRGGTAGRVAASTRQRLSLHPAEALEEPPLFCSFSVRLCIRAVKSDRQVGGWVANTVGTPREDNIQAPFGCRSARSLPPPHHRPLTVATGSAPKCRETGRERRPVAHHGHEGPRTTVAAALQAAARAEP